MSRAAAAAEKKAAAPAAASAAPASSSSSAAAAGTEKKEEKLDAQKLEEKRAEEKKVEEKRAVDEKRAEEKRALLALAERLVVGSDTSVFSFRLWWETAESTEAAVEVDLAAFAVDDDGKVIAACDSENRSVLGGDLRFEQKADGEESDDTLAVDTSRIHADARVVYFVMGNFASEGKLEDVDELACTVRDVRAGKELITYKLGQKNPKGSHVVLCSIARVAKQPHLWEVVPLRKIVTLTKPEETAPLLGELCRALETRTRLPLNDIELARSRAFYETFAGRSLTPPERVLAKGTLMKLQINRNLRNLRFWGKILGQSNDYIIVKNTEFDDDITKQFFYSADGGLNWFLFPKLDDWANARCGFLRGYFKGDPSTAYKDPTIVKKKPVEGEEEPEEEEEEEEEPVEEGKEPPRKIKEEERLAFVVNQIDHNTAIVPLGYYFMNAFGRIVRNSQFKGLSGGDSLRLTSYQIFRSPENPQTLARIRRSTLDNRYDFLDTINETTLGGVWSLQVDDGGENVTVRSMIYPGYEYHLEVNNPDNAAGAYFGWGDINDSLIFMLPQSG